MSIDSMQAVAKTRSAAPWTLTFTARLAHEDRLDVVMEGYLRGNDSINGENRTLTAAIWAAAGAAWSWSLSQDTA